MTKREKRLQKIRQNPRNVSFDELRQVLEDYGFELRRINGSHHIFRAEVNEVVWSLTIPLKKPHLKPSYVQASLDAIDEILEVQLQDENGTDKDQE